MLIDFNCNFLTLLLFYFVVFQLICDGLRISSLLSSPYFIYFCDVVGLIHCTELVGKIRNGMKQKRKDKSIVLINSIKFSKLMVVKQCHIINLWFIIMTTIYEWRAVTMCVFWWCNFFYLRKLNSSHIWFHFVSTRREPKRLSGLLCSLFYGRYWVGGMVEGLTWNKLQSLSRGACRTL